MLTVLAATPPTLGDDAFGGCDDLAIINVSAGSEDAYTNWGSYTITGKNLFLTPVSTSWTVEIGSDFDSQTFTITNVSSRQIIVSVALGGIDWGSFTLNKSEFTLAAGGTATFSVTPNTGLKQSTYTATVTVTATVDSESVTETANITFFVNPKSPAGARVQVSGSYTYNGARQKPGYEAAHRRRRYRHRQGKYNGTNTVEFTSVTLDEIRVNNDVSVDMSTSTLTGTLPSADPDTYHELTLSGTVTLTGKDAGNYTLTLPIEGVKVNVESGVTISRTPSSPATISIEDAEVTLSQSDFIYNSQSQIPGVTVVLNGETLDATCCQVNYNGGIIDAGTYTVTVEGSGNYTGWASSMPTYTISPATVTPSISGNTTKIYDGSTTATGLTIALAGVVNSDDVTATASFAYNSANVTEADTITAKDAGTVSDWAYEAMRWAVAEGIIEGDENGLISPTATATRAQAATMLMRFCENDK